MYSNRRGCPATRDIIAAAKRVLIQLKMEQQTHSIELWHKFHCNRFSGMITVEESFDGVNAFEALTCITHDQGTLLVKDFLCE